MEFYEIGQSIKKLRKDKKMTQEMLASEAGITRQTVSKLEKGNIDKVSLQVYIKLLDALGYNLNIFEKKPFYYFNADSL